MSREEILGLWQGLNPPRPWEPCRRPLLALGTVSFSPTKDQDAEAKSPCCLGLIMVLSTSLLLASVSEPITSVPQGWRCKFSATSVKNSS